MCLCPVTIKVDYPTTHSIQVPCGHCSECLRNYQNDWFVRLYNEFLDSKKCLFVTLTYKPEKVPTIVDTETGEYAYSVYVKHLQDALKRYRTNQERAGKYKKFKYFFCSEYGPTTLRPHYHALIFGLDYLDFKPFLDDWQNTFGFVHCDTVKFSKDDACKVARYVSKYCCKGMLENPYVSYGLANKTFRIVSKHIGLGYVQRSKAYHLGTSIFKGRKFLNGDKSLVGYNRDYISYVAHNRYCCTGNENIKYRMPRYYKEKIYGSKNPLSVAVSNFLFQEHGELYLQKLRDVSAEWNCSEAEASSIMAMQDLRDKSYRDKETVKQLQEFYFRSKI